MDIYLENINKREKYHNDLIHTDSIDLLSRKTLVIKKILGELDVKPEIKGILLEVPMDKLVKNIVFLNKKSNIGKFAMMYSLRLNSLNGKKLKKFLLNPYSEEFDDNHFLNKEDKEHFDQLIKSEEVIIEFLIEKLSLDFGNKIPDKIMDLDYKKCQSDVCMVYQEELITPKNYVWISGIDNYLDKLWCFRINELILIILTDKINPYTNKPFKNKTVNKILNMYRREVLLCKRFLELS